MHLNFKLLYKFKFMIINTNLKICSLYPIIQINSNLVQFKFMIIDETLNICLLYPKTQINSVTILVQF